MAVRKSYGSPLRTVAVVHETFGCIHQSVMFAGYIFKKSGESGFFL
jgi:hypothetical protein